LGTRRDWCRADAPEPHSGPVDATKHIAFGLFGNLEKYGGPVLVRLSERQLAVPNGSVVIFLVHLPNTPRNVSFGLNQRRLAYQPSNRLTRLLFLPRE
jgi:hypothetical protein